MLHWPAWFAGSVSGLRDRVEWLVRPVPGMRVRPLDLLRDGRWRAFRGAIRARSAPVVRCPPEELIRRRRAQASWVTVEPPVVVEGDA